LPVAHFRDRAGVCRRGDARRSCLRWPLASGAATIGFTTSRWIVWAQKRTRGSTTAPSVSTAARRQ
jgi:hypothetical protein